jgi:hypothetical protein
MFRDEREAVPAPNRQGDIATIVGSSFLPENAGRSDGTGATAAARSPWWGSRKRPQSRYNAVHEWGTGQDGPDPSLPIGLRRFMY